MTVGAVVEAKVLFMRFNISKRMRRSPPCALLRRSREFLLLNWGDVFPLSLLLYAQRIRKDRRAEPYFECRYYGTRPNIFRDHRLLAMIIAKFIQFASRVIFPTGHTKQGVLHIHSIAAGEQIICVVPFTGRVKIRTA